MKAAAAQERLAPVGLPIDEIAVVGGKAGVSVAAWIDGKRSAKTLRPEDARQLAANLIIAAEAVRR